METSRMFTGHHAPAVARAGTEGPPGNRLPTWFRPRSETSGRNIGHTDQDTLPPEPDGLIRAVSVGDRPLHSPGSTRQASCTCTTFFPVI